MKRIHFNMESDSFYGTYRQCREHSGCAVIAVAGDALEDYLAKAYPKECKDMETGVCEKGSRFLTVCCDCGNYGGSY